MSDEQAAQPPDSQLVSSDLPNAPSIKEDEVGNEIQVKFTEPLSPLPQSQEPAAENTIIVAPESEEKVSSSSRPKRSSRNVRPARYVESDDEIVADVEEAGEEEKEESQDTSTKRVPAKRSSTNSAATTRPPAKRAKPNPRAKKAKWDPKFVTQNSKSPLVGTDLRSLLLQPAAWDCLTEEDKKVILALMPDKTHILHQGTSEARPNFESLRNDNNFRHDCDQYVFNLSNGMHDPTWLRDAWAARERRKTGQFDEFHIRKLELDWGATIPDQYKPKHLQPQQNGESSASNGQAAADEVVEKQETTTNFTSQAFAVKPAAKGKAGKKNASKKKAPAAAKRTGKGAQVANPKHMAGLNKSTKGKPSDADKGYAVGEDTGPKSTAAVTTKDEDQSCIQVAEDLSSDPHKRETVAACKQEEAASSGLESGEVTPEPDGMDVDKAG